MDRLSTLAFLLCLATPACSDQPAPWEVVYLEAPDRECAVSRGYAIEEAWVGELKRVLPAFREEWSRVGPKLFAAAESLTHRPTDGYVEPIGLTLCDTPSQSFDGPIVNMRFALHSFTTTPVPLRYKVDTAFHESLHRFVVDHAPRDSALLAAHPSESPCVRNHLHLLALQKAVLLALGDTAALEQVVAIDSTLPSGCYERAWALIDETDGGYEAYVAELGRPS